MKTMKTIYLTILIVLTACKSDAANNDNLIEKTSSHPKTEKHKRKVNGVTEIENNDFIISALNQNLKYETISNSFPVITLSEKSIVNNHDNSKMDREITLSLSNDSKTVFSYYLTDTNNIFLKGIIYSPDVELPFGINVGMHISQVEQVFGCIIQSSITKFRIYDSDNLIEIILNFNQWGDIIFMEINNNGYLS